MQLERLGVIVFFGMIVPGAFLTASILLAFACLLEVNGIRGHAEIFSFISKSLVLSTTAFFFLSYLLGVVLRLFAPSLVDRASTFYLKYVLLYPFRKKGGLGVDEEFPYWKSLESYMEKQGMGEVAAFMENLNKDYGKSGNTTFIGYCKLLIEANNDNLAKHVQQSEALVRFLSGTSLALVVAIGLGVASSFMFWQEHKTLFSQVYAGISVVSFLTLAGILARFKHQRRREVIILWNSVYLLLKGCVPNTLGISPIELTNRVKLISPNQPSSSDTTSSNQSSDPSSHKNADPARLNNKSTKEDSGSDDLGISTSLQ